MRSGNFLSQFLIARSFNMRVFKTEMIEDLTVEQFNVLTELYIYERERELEDMREAESARATGRGSTVRISNRQDR